MNNTPPQITRADLDKLLYRTGFEVGLQHGQEIYALKDQVDFIETLEERVLRGYDLLQQIIAQNFIITEEL